MLNDVTGMDGRENSAACEDGLRLWQRMLKLRWLRLEGEAESVASEVRARRCGQPLRLPPRLYPTD